MIAASSHLGTSDLATSNLSTSYLAADATAPLTTAGPAQLVIAALVGIAAIVALIVWGKLHPFLSLMLGSAVLALVAGIGLTDTFTAFTKGVGSTVGGTGVLIALGAIIGMLLVKSGGADAIVEGFLDRTTAGKLPWVMAALAFVIGIPLFFEVGVVLLIPVVMLAAKRARQPVILLGIPALAGLSALHGLVPPHPGPLIAIDALGANLGLTLGLGLIVAVPCVVLAGPVAGKFMARWVPIPAPDTFTAGEPVAEEDRPGVAVSLSVVLLPVVLMLLRTLVETAWAGGTGNPAHSLVMFAGTPLVALLATSLYAMWVLGMRGGRGLKEVSDLVGASFAGIAGILLIVGAGGGFKETLVASGVAGVIGDWLSGAAISPLLAAWLVAVFIRLATGSATVATITAAGIMAPIATGLDPATTALMVLAIGAGSVFFSHVNDAGFWLVKEYFGMTVPQTLKTWSLMETILSVVGLITVMLLGLVV
ncbi:gluconate:H+ symporter [Corynebacterium hansenii]|uniref:Gluconate:H+ symporter n=1 Tax=Corynebacterium hansenii TaxID=394964 RepID=A0ABV7ZTH7_9CORY|nr:gluconate:H+ symporter [Corynebacterium hansenii]WJZ01261.1 High-affinity gluconate transporter [Corynebacterium hansenii]